MADSLNITVLSLDIVWASPESNITMVEKLMATMPDNTDIVVLPELFTTAFVQDERLLQDLTGQYQQTTIEFLKRISAKYNCAICGSIIFNEKGNYFNRCLFVEPDGRITTYDKRHLFSLSAESRLFKHGESSMPVVEFRDWKVSMMICYDLRFPVWARRGTPSYDVLLVPANWPSVRGYAWEHLLIARAIENQVFVVGANRSGEDDFGNYNGLSQIYDVMGMPLCENSGDSIIISSSISKNNIIKARKKLPAEASADNFNIVY